jgi:hypothetical protein
MPESLFVRDGDRYVPTVLSRGPWSPDALHGGPPAALLARAVERFEGAEFFVSRLTVELLRPVPLEPLTVTARLSRPGRKVQLVETSLRTDTHEVARATGLRIRVKEIPLPPDLTDEPPPRAIPERSAASVHAPVFGDGFHNRAVEHRFAYGSFVDRGPALDWMRLLVPLVPDEPTTALQRVAALADFGNGISSVLPPTHTYINPDLTVSLQRYPRGEWICLYAKSRIETAGVGVAESRLYDETGRIGTAIQHLIVDLRDP